jgi:hypothetical protein
MKEDITDYAMPLMKIERFTKEIHDLCLEHRYEEAREEALRLGAETRVLQHTLTIMKENTWSIPRASKSDASATA